MDTPNPSSETAYIELLGLAYEVPLQNVAFEKFLDAAHDFFAVDPETGEVDRSIIGNGAAHSELDAHADRLARVFDMAIAAEDADAAVATHHAVLSINPNSHMVTANAAAEKLIGSEGLIPLNELMVDHTAVKAIENALGQSDHQDRIFLTSVGEDDSRACLGLIRSSAHSGDELHVSLSYVHWSEGLLSRLGNALGLTASETEVLACYLQNQSPKDIAEQRGRSPETIKAQSKSILRKVGCARMADVVQLSAGIAYMLRQMPETEQSSDTLSSWKTPTTNLETFQREGRTVAYYRHGSGSRIVVFIHALIQGPFFHPDFLCYLDEHNVTLLAPSRPSYGYTSSPKREALFEQTVIDDALALINLHTEGNVHIVAQQLGTSHGARLANALGERSASLILINGGIPLKPEHYAGMDRRVRFAAMAARFAPSILKLSNTLGVRNFRRSGADKFLIDRYSSSETDMGALRMPGVMELHALGLFHSVEQDGAPYLLDEKSKHADWSEDLASVACPQFWLQPENCRIVRAENVEAVTRSLRSARYILEPDASSILLYERPKRVAEFVVQSMREALQPQSV
ncbi:MAG: alpha/beta hydrolase [Pseudomonadota bacterium]